MPRYEIHSLALMLLRKTYTLQNIDAGKQQLIIHKDHLLAIKV